jgi:hypothetical protein
MIICGFDAETGDRADASKPCRLCASIILEVGIGKVEGLDADGKLKEWDKVSVYNQ